MHEHVVVGLVRRGSAPVAVLSAFHPSSIVQPVISACLTARYPPNVEMRRDETRRDDTDALLPRFPSTPCGPPDAGGA